MKAQKDTEVTDPRSQILAEHRSRIRHGAQRQTWTQFSVNSNNSVYTFRVWIDLYSADGAIESNGFFTWITSLYQLNPNGDDLSGTVLTIDNKDLEIVADELYEQIATRYPDRSITIEVTANGEYGTSIDYNLTRPNLSIKY